MKIFAILGLLCSFLLNGQTQIDYTTQVKNRPIVSDAGAATFAVACARGSGGATVSVTKAWLNVPAQSCSANLAFNGGSIQPGSGAVVTLTGAVTAAAVKIFDYSAGGTVVMTGATVGQVVTQWFGAVGDGSTYDSSAVQAAITAFGGTGVNVRFPRTATNIYIIKNIVVGSHIKIFCDQGVTLKLPNGLNGSTDSLFYNSVTGTETTDIDIGEGCILDGNRATESGGAGDGDSMAYLFNGSSNTTFHGTIKNFWTDAIYIGCAGIGAAANTLPGNKITFATDLHITSSRRNNISIICGTNVSFNNPYLSLAGATVGQVGISPFTNIDIEPNTATNVIQGITGSFTSISPLRNHLAIAEQFVNRPNIGIDLHCNSCTGAVQSVVIVTDFGTGYVIGGVNISGNFSNNGTGGGGNSSIVIGSTVTQSTVSCICNEELANSQALSINGTYISLGAGSYRGATYDYYMDAGSVATSSRSTAAAVFHTEATAYNTAGVQFLPGSSGTFTPVLAFGGGVTGITYGTRIGTYYAIGSTVTVSIHFVLTSKGSSTGAVTITGLPFASTSASAGICGYWANTGGVVYPPTLYMASGGSGFSLLQSNGGTGAQGLLNTNLANNTEMIMTITYGR